MGKLLGLVGGLFAYVCVASVITMTALLFYAKSKGFLDPEKVAKMMAVARGEEIASAKAAVPTKSEKTDAEPTFDMREQQFQLRDMRLKLRESTLKTELDNLSEERLKLNDERSKFDLQKRLYDEQAKNFVNSVIQEGRENIRKIWENIKPKTSKELMVIMITNNQINEVAKIFSSVPTAKQAKIIAEFKTPDEQQKLNEVLELIRVPPTNQQPAATTAEPNANNTPNTVQ